VTDAPQGYEGVVGGGDLVRLEAEGLVLQELFYRLL
jgi:hypothetical protein